MLSISLPLRLLSVLDDPDREEPERPELERDPEVPLDAPRLDPLVWTESPISVARACCTAWGLAPRRLTTSTASSDSTAALSSASTNCFTS